MAGTQSSNTAETMTHEARAKLAGAAAAESAHLLASAAPHIPVTDAGIVLRALISRARRLCDSVDVLIHAQEGDEDRIAEAVREVRRG